jgi:hypothetical protein
VTEDELQRQVVEWLYVALPPGCVVHHSPNEGTRHVAFKQKLKRSGTRFGWPDLEIFVPGDLAVDGASCSIFIELKRPKGGSLSANQKQVRDDLLGAGCHWGLARSVDQVHEILQALVKLRVRNRACTYSDSLGKCRGGMIREPDGDGCVQWTTCPDCQGRGWV